MSRDDRRAAIAAATAPLLVQHGVGITTRQIADAAGLAEGTLFRAFTDKEELLRAAAKAALDPAPAVAAIARVPDNGLVPLLIELTDMLQQGIVQAVRTLHAVGTVLGHPRAHRFRATDLPPGDPGAEEGPHHDPGAHAGDPRVQLMQAIRAAITARIEPHAAELRLTPAATAQVLLSLVLGQWPPGVRSDVQLDAAEIVGVVTVGVLVRQDPSP